jgi:dsDNA-binding SOS-regulon protein
MKSLLSIIMAITCMSFFSCKNAHTYDKYVKELDSLKVVLQQSVDNFKTVDSATCVNAYSKQYTYSQFIETHLKDTVTKLVAENLQNLQSVKQGLNDYLTLRSNWLVTANTSIKQLQTLSHDLKNGSLNEEEAIEFINQEKKQAELIIEELKVNTENIRKHLEVYNQSLPVCENLVRELNSGVLPQLLSPPTKQ